MADAGVSEAAAVESAKGAGEAAAADTALTAGATDAAATAGAAGATDAAATAGAAGATDAGATLGTLGAGGTDVTALAPSGLTGLGASTAAEIPTIASAGLPDLASASSTLGTLGAGGTDVTSLASGGLTGLGASGPEIPTIASEGLGDLSGYGAGGAYASPGALPAGSAQPGPEAIENLAQPGASGATPETTISGTVSKALDALGTGALKYGPLLNSAVGLARQGSGSAQKQLNAAAAPAQAASNQLLAQFQSGQLNGSDQYAIAQYTREQKAKTDQYYQNAGLANSSMHQAALQQIDQQAEAMRQQAVQNLLKNGLSAAGVSNPLIQAGVNAGMKEDAAAQQAMSQFISALAKMNTPTPAPTGSPS